MKKKEQKINNGIFPINYKGKLWTEKDCDDVFLAFYEGKHSLNCDCAVYIMDGDWIFPDGKILNDDDDDF